MLDFKDIVIDNEATLGKAPKLSSVEEVEEYDSNKKPTGKIVGYRYMISVPNRRYRKVGVKIPGDKLLDKKDDMEIVVAFENLKLFPYAFIDDEGKLRKGVAGTASSIKKVN